MLKQYLALLLSALSINIYAADIPPDLMFEGKPIDSVCFNVKNNETLIDLNTCGLKAKNLVEKNDFGYDLKNEGFIGHGWEDRDDPSYDQGSIYYKFYPAGGRKYWIETISNYGGSAVIGEISLIERKDKHTLAYQAISGGDRCYGGVGNIQVKDNQLTFSKSLTAFHLVELGYAKPMPNLDQNDLASCMACCVASAVYTMNPGDAKPQLLRVEIDKDSSYIDDGARGSCFSGLLGGYLSKGATFKPEELGDFSREFKRACLDGNGVKHVNKLS